MLFCVYFGKPIWTHENHAVELITNKFIRQKCAYIHRNPVRAGWVNNAGLGIQ